MPTFHKVLGLVEGLSLCNRFGFSQESLRGLNTYSQAPSLKTGECFQGVLAMVRTADQLQGLPGSCMF